MGHFYKYNNSEPLQSQAPKNQAFKICPEKNTFHPSKKQPIINIAISAACETEGKNAMLLMGVLSAIHSSLYLLENTPIPSATSPTITSTGTASATNPATTSTIRTTGSTTRVQTTFVSPQAA